MRGLFLLAVILSTCSTTLPKQGIKGQVLWVSGNQLPGPDSKRTAHYGVQRELHIYELTTTHQATMSPEGFFSNIKTKLVTVVTTKADGSFKLRLPAGKYSVFVKEDKGLFANHFDENNAINLITVKEKQFTWLPISIDYQAAY